MLGHTHSNTHVFVVMRPKSQSIMRAMRMYTVCGTVHAQWTILNHFVHKSAILKSMRTCIELIFVCFFPRLAPVCTVTTVSNRLFFLSDTCVPESTKLPEMRNSIFHTACMYLCVSTHGKIDKWQSTHSVKSGSRDITNRYRSTHAYIHSLAYTANANEDEGRKKIKTK